MNKKYIRKTGKVVSDNLDKSIVVKVIRKVKHKLLGVYFNKSKKFIVHDENNNFKIGDLVTFRQCRPISKRKCWIVEEEKS